MKLDENLKEIESIVARLENPEINIDEGIELYEKGVSIAKDCLSELNNVKGKINVIKKDLDAFKEESLD